MAPVPKAPLKFSLTEVKTVKIVTPPDSDGEKVFDQENVNLIGSKKVIQNNRLQPQILYPSTPNEECQKLRNFESEVNSNEEREL